MLRHPKPSSPNPEQLAAFHNELIRNQQRWRVCPLVRIEPADYKCREVRRCPFCSAELIRPLRSLVLQYADQDSVAVLPNAMLSIPVGVPLAEIQKDVVEQVYELVGSVKATAQLLGVGRRTLYQWCPHLSLREEVVKEIDFTVPRPPRKPRQ